MDNQEVDGEDRDRRRVEDSWIILQVMVIASGKLTVCELENGP
jgi:hypothetical protein